MDILLQVMPRLSTRPGELSFRRRVAKIVKSSAASDAASEGRAEESREGGNTDSLGTRRKGKLINLKV